MAITHINKLKSIRNELAALYKEKATDADDDKGELATIHSAIISVENTIQKLSQ